MEHSTEYKKIMRARKKREMLRRRKFRQTMFAGAGVVCVLLIGMLILGLAIRREHKKAVDDYNENNWTTVETVEGGRIIYGKEDGEDFRYTDNGRFFEGIYVDGVHIGGMNYAEARRAIMDLVEEKLIDLSMVVTVGNASLALSASDFNITVNAEKILSAAYRLGRESLNDYGANYKRQQKLREEHVEFHITYECDRDSIRSRVDRIAQFVNTEPVEPYISAVQRPAANTESGGEGFVPQVTEPGVTYDTIYADNGVAIAYVYFHPGRDGFVLNEDSMVDRIINAFEEGDYDCVLSAELEDTPPSMEIGELKASFGKLTLYTTSFDTKKPNRCRNIQKAAGILNACEIKPLQEISFNEYIGPRTEAGGWLPAAGITGGKEYTNSPGGGICQVSGTLYNALLQCGPNKIKVTQRQHHTWPSEYLPYGLDATVDTNGPDLKWRNISDKSIFIFAYADLNKGVMYVYAYGEPEPDGSYYKTSAETIEEIEPEEPLQVEDPDRPAGYRKVTVTARKGYKAVAYLNRYNADGELVETTVIHNDYYRPIRGEITIGTGAPRPES